MNLPSFLTIFIIIISLSSNAEVTLDGSLGQQGVLSGPNYLIGADLGQQHGGNLFHSFQDFNLQSHEGAIFSGPNSVNNIISRVTGGNPSNIDGLIRSTIPQANMYFLNPYGIVFGPNAELDVQGSFHASTADYLRLGGNGRFDARQPNNSLLTVAPVQAFGFLTDTPAQITVQESYLHINKGKHFSFVGGDLHFNGSPFGYDIDKLDLPTPHLFAESGQFNLISVASRGEIISTDSGFSTNLEKAQLGQITLDNVLLSVSGNKGGDIFIRAGHLKLINSVIESNTHNENGGVINIAVDQFDLLGHQNTSAIYTHTGGKGNGGTVNLHVKQLNLSENAQIGSITIGSGRAGTILIKQAETVNISGIQGFNDDGFTGIYSLSVGEENNAGDAGNIDIEAHQITLNSGFISNGTRGYGEAGRIDIKAHQIMLSQGGQIFNRTLGSGNSGIINLSVTDSIIASGKKSQFDEASGIIGQSGHIVMSKAIFDDNDIIKHEKLPETPNTGDAADINIVASQIILEEEAEINSDSFGLGNGGNISIKNADQIMISSEGQITSSTFGKGKAGNISIENVHHIFLLNGGLIGSNTFDAGKAGGISIKNTDIIDIVGQHETDTASAITTSTLGLEHNAGDAGHIEIEANQITLKEGGAIYNATIGYGNGGTTHITTDTFTASDGLDKPWDANFNPHIRFLPSGIFATAVNINSNAGNAGHIQLNARHIELTDGGQINSDTYGGGTGGSIEVEGVEKLIAKGKYAKENLVYYSGINSSSKNSEPYAGKAGNIFVQANKIKLANEGEISTKALNAAGGNIVVNTSHLLYLQGGKITTSVKGGSGKGGNITIENPIFVVLEKAHIKGQADEGHGGDIDITSNQFIASPCSVVSASSRLGIDGEVNIDSPDMNMDEFLIVLPENFLDASTQLQKPCRKQATDKKNSFVVKHLNGSPPSPYDWKSSKILR
ncbi:filamentous hemagglutinin N-terminal domain-containing protein [Candidatus Parabeggiatoa sp. HSG14]|uniref:two-partner secretion domain-containing protein n=1 Tax=Candidatus Parabeggiatoa sp. HSG14 TaxID=3055593 RepID=UPI0025A83D3C|nr:filamentous hemagglutinin N-terminal domain-containing protein [Thiotrichales bacterium HSG14]